MRCATQLALDALCDSEHFLWRNVAIDSNSNVIKDIITTISPCLTLDDATHLGRCVQRAFECFDSVVKVCSAVAKIAAYVEVECHCEIMGLRIDITLYFEKRAGVVPALWEYLL